MLRKIFAKMAEKPRFIKLNHADAQANLINEVSHRLYPANLTPALLVTGVAAITTAMQQDIGRGAALMGIGYLAALMTHHYPSTTIQRMAPKISSASIDTAGETPRSAFNHLFEREAKALFNLHRRRAIVDVAVSLVMLQGMARNIMDGQELLAATLYSSVFVSLATKSLRTADTAKKIMSGAYTVCPTSLKMRVG